MKQIVLKQFTDIVSGPDKNINLAEAALLAASSKYPDIDIPLYLSLLDTMATDIRGDLHARDSEHAVIDVLNHYLFEDKGFSANVVDFYDPKNSYLNDVLDRKLGIPITLSLIYMEVGSRLGLTIQGISFPGHFLVKLVDPEGDKIIDPFSRGIVLERKDLIKRLSWFSSP